MRTRTRVLVFLAVFLAALPGAGAGAKSEPREDATVRVVMSASGCRLTPTTVASGDVRFEVRNVFRAVRWFAIAGKRTPTLRQNGHAVLAVSLPHPAVVPYVCGAPGAKSLVRRGVLRVQSSPAPRSIVIDTDMSVDDWMAILFLLHRPDVSVKAITVSGTGVAHGEPGAQNVLRLLDLDDAPAISVAVGRPTTFPGGHSFPEAWRPALDSMLGLPLPPSGRSVSTLTAAELLLKTAQAGPIDLLSLGPPTNIADALTQSPSFASRVRSVTVMSGALDVPGNAGDGSADWNFYVDPAAADIVFRSGIPVTLVPLDATNAVPYNAAFVDRLAADRRTAAARFVYDALARQMPGAGLYFWDPLAATVMVDPTVATLENRTVSVVTAGEAAGRTISGASGTPIRAAVHGDRARFEQVFLETLNRPRA